VSKIPSVTISELIAAGIHFGHKTMRWNPKMASYLYGVKDGIHIIDLQQTLPLLNSALEKVYDVAKNNGRILFVGTKMQASDIISDSAKRCGQYYVNHRWLGGMLTNWSTINHSIKKLQDLEKIIADADEADSQFDKPKFTKKERLDITRKIEKLEKSIGGIREMGGIPNLLFVIDTNKEDISIQEAKKLGIPVIAILDSNSNPDDIAYPVPGNDDATRSIKLYSRLVSDAVLHGMKESLVDSGVDLGELADLENIVELKANRKNENKKKDFKKKTNKADPTPAKEEKAKAVEATPAPKKAAEEKPKTTKATPTAKKTVKEKEA
jgi:small subunit ribosomal protein S2